MIQNNVLEKLEYFKILEYISKYANTDTGKETILNFKPITNAEEILKRGKYVSEAKEILINNDIPPFNYIPNLYETLSRSTIEGSVLMKREIRDTLQLAKTSRMIRNFLVQNSNSGLYEDLGQNLFVDKHFENEIDIVFTETGEISDNASQELRKIRKDINSKSETLRKVIAQILKKLSTNYFVQDEYATQRDGRFVLPVKAEYKRQVKGFIHSESATGQTVYIEPEETLNLNNEILSLNFSEKREIEKILKKLTKSIAQNYIELTQSLRFLSQLDAIFAKAKYSMEILGEFPELNEDKPFRILEGRHPVLIKKLGRKNTIPLNLDFKDNVILITGPNAGGKTVVLKTTGLLMAMACTGIHIPAHPDTNLHLMDKILIDIGDQQSIEDDLSTFSSHLTNIKSILEEADEKTLVLIDEIGTGTDPAEGSALATGVLIKLKDNKTKVLATTHHGNLKMIANDMDGFQNASMEYDTKHLLPTYKFVQGLPGSSYAFEVAQRIGFEEELLKTSKKYLDTDKTKIEEFLVDLEKKSQDVRNKLNKLEIENSKLKGMTALYQKKIDNLEKQKKSIVAETQAEAESYLSDVNKKVEAAIRNIKESNAKKEVIKKEKEIISELKKKNEKIKKKVKEQPEVKDYVPKVGDYVSIANTNTTGEIVEIIPEKKKAMIAAGSIKLQVKLSRLIPQKRRASQQERVYGIEFTNTYTQTSLDIRGEKPEEAEYETVKFLDDAYAGSLERVEIIHGKGSGILKKTVHELLKQHEHVKNYYFAKIEMGGEGVTIVEIK